jgi:hypothetical protein
MFKLKNSAMLMVAALCGYMALMTPDWKGELNAAIGAPYTNNIDGQGGSDVVLRKDDGTWKVYNVISLSNAGAAQSTNMYANNDYVFQDIGDYDGDGTDDVLTRRTSNGSWIAFLMDGAANQGTPTQVSLFTGATWEFRASVDVDADGDEDIILRRPSDGLWRLFIIENGAVTSSSVPSLPYQSTAWTYVGAADFDGDGDDDILEWNAAVTKWRIFYANAGDFDATDTQNSMYTSSVISYQSAGDADKDGDADILLRRTDNGKWLIHEFAGGYAVGGSVTVANMFTAAEWEFRNFADLDADGDTDVLMRRTTDGVWRTFEIENRDYTKTTATFGLYASSAWTIRTTR